MDEPKGHASRVARIRPAAGRRATRTILARPPAAARAFTLVELMLVLAIGLVAVMLAPAIPRSLTSPGFRSPDREIRAALPPAPEGCDDARTRSSAKEIRP